MFVLVKMQENSFLVYVYLLQQFKDGDFFFFKCLKDDSFHPRLSQIDRLLLHTHTFCEDGEKTH